MLKTLRDLFLLHSLLIPGCATTLPSQDFSISAISAGYPTVEFSLENQVFLGLGQSLIEAGQPLDSLRLYVQGYLSGTVTIESARCNIHYSGTYSNSQKIRVPIEGIAKDSCIIDVGVFPHFYEDGALQELATEGMKGSFFLKVSKEVTLANLLTSDKVPEMSDVITSIPIGYQPDLSEAEAMFGGCGVEPAIKKYLVENSAVNVSLSSVLGSLDEPKMCVLEGAVKSPEVNRRVSWNVAIYNSSFSPLAVPDLSMDGLEATVTSDPESSLLLVNDQVYWGQRAKFKIKQDETYVVRSISIKGRVSLCILSEGGESWSCQQ